MAGGDLICADRGTCVEVLICRWLHIQEFFLFCKQSNPFDGLFLLHNVITAKRSFVCYFGVKFKLQYNKAIVQLPNHNLV